MQLIATVTQGAANGFIQGTINTGLSATLNTGYKLTQIDVEWPDLLPAGATALIREYSLTRASKASVPALSDDDVLWRDKTFILPIGAAYSIVLDQLTSERPSDDILLIEEQIYIGFKTLNCTLAGSLIIKLTVEPVKVTDSQRIAILQSRVN
jgi:hypothetical protein